MQIGDPKSDGNHSERTGTKASKNLIFETVPKSFTVWENINNNLVYKALVRAPQNLRKCNNILRIPNLRLETIPNRNLCNANFTKEFSLAHQI